jgi:hypothetical protein
MKPGRAAIVLCLSLALMPERSSSLIILNRLAAVETKEQGVSL